MKKVIILTAILALNSLCAMAVIDSRYTTSEQYLKNCGYSNETIRLIQLKKKDPYAMEEERKKPSAIVRFWRYLDPAADNGYFGNSDINPDAAAPDINL